MDAKLFLEEIVAVCRKHKMMLTVSEYDNLQVWPLGVGDHQEEDEFSLQEILDAEVRL